jgi:REP element-mobilizing transposase RayT
MRQSRYFQKDSYYHLITRGNNQNLFIDKWDFIRFLKILEKYLSKFSIRLLCYVLMPNHIHLLVQQTSNQTLSNFMHSLTTSYVVYFNSKYKKKGHLFEGRYKHIEITTDEYLVHLSRYIHLNPSSAGLVKTPENYPWSSYRHYLGLEREKFVDERVVLGYFSSKNAVSDYKYFVESRIDYQKEISFQKLFLE